MSKPKIFISYSWDSNLHINHVTKLAQSLRTDGIECIIDNFKDYLDEETNWETWIDKNIQSVEYILVVCTENYKNCFDNNKNCAGDGGVKWEAELLRILLKKDTIKIVTIIFNEQDKRYIPDRLHGKNRYFMSELRFDVHDERSDYHKLYRKLTKQHNIEPNEIGKIVVLPTEKENLLNKLTQFITNESINLQELKDISKLFLEENNNHKILGEQKSISSIVDYLDNLIINYEQPIFCIINYIYQEKNSNNQKIKEWLEENYKEDICNKIKIKTKNLLDKQRLLKTQNEELFKDRIVLDFAKSETPKKVDLTIRYFQDGKFQSNEESAFKERDITNKSFKKEIFDTIYDILDLYDYVEIVLPKEFLLENIKQWSYYDDDLEKSVCFTGECGVNIHIRERAYLSQIRKLWDIIIQQIQSPICNCLLDINTSKEIVDSSNKEVGLKYRFYPDNTSNFFDRAKRKGVTIRCSDKNKFEEFDKWIDDNKNLKLKELKSEVDKPKNSYITIIWSDPNIPLKGEYK